jgi:hypothetical protein
VDADIRTEQASIPQVGESGPEFDMVTSRTINLGRKVTYIIYTAAGRKNAPSWSMKQSVMAPSPNICLVLDDAPPSYLAQKFRIVQAFLEQRNVIDNANEIAAPSPSPSCAWAVLLIKRISVAQAMLQLDRYRQFAWSRVTFLSRHGTRGASGEGDRPLAVMSTFDHYLDSRTTGCRPKRWKLE